MATPGARRALSRASLAFCCCLAALTARADELVIDEARVRELIPGRDTTSAYLRVTNPGPEPVTISGAESPSARAIEFHVTERDGDMLRMRRLPSVTIAAGATVSFEPGGRHLMLFGVGNLADQVSIQLVLGDGTRQEVGFTRVAAGAP
jgi:copper(I)-binding protein